MPEHCFWILTNGAIVIPDSRHILAVVCCPIAFDETKESIRETFEKQNQSPDSNFEGVAREEVLSRVIHRNHIRIRKNLHRENQHWSIQLHNLTAERRASISAWANYISADTEDIHADVIIHQFHNGSKFQISLNTLAEEYSGDDKKTVIVTQQELSGL